MLTEARQQESEVEVARRVLRNQAHVLEELAEAPLYNRTDTGLTYDTGVQEQDIIGVANLVRYVLFTRVPGGVFDHLGFSHGELWDKHIVATGNGKDPYGRQPGE